MSRELILASGHITLVDDEDYDKLRVHSWHLATIGRSHYAKRTVWKEPPRNPPSREIILIHREIMSAPKGLVVDHIDGDGLNNTKANLRICTVAQNVRGARVRVDTGSGYKGVGYHKKAKKWCARIVFEGKSKYIGLFDSKEDAAHAYDEEARRTHGEYAKLNFKLPKLPDAAGLLAGLI